MTQSVSFTSQPSSFMNSKLCFDEHLKFDGRQTWRAVRFCISEIIGVEDFFFWKREGPTTNISSPSELTPDMMDEEIRDDDKSSSLSCIDNSIRLRLFFGYPLPSRNYFRVPIKIFQPPCGFSIEAKYFVLPHSNDSAVECEGEPEGEDVIDFYKDEFRNSKQSSSSSWIRPHPPPFPLSSHFSSSAVSEGTVGVSGVTVLGGEDRRGDDDESSRSFDCRRDPQQQRLLRNSTTSTRSSRTSSDSRAVIGDDMRIKGIGVRMNGSLKEEEEEDRQRGGGTTDLGDCFDSPLQTRRSISPILPINGTVEGEEGRSLLLTESDVLWHKVRYGNGYVRGEEWDIGIVLTSSILMSVKELKQTIIDTFKKLEMVEEEFEQRRRGNGAGRNEGEKEQNGTMMIDETVDKMERRKMQMKGGEEEELICLDVSSDVDNNTVNDEDRTKGLKPKKMKEIPKLLAPKSRKWAELTSDDLRLHGMKSSKSTKSQTMIGQPYADNWKVAIDPTTTKGFVLYVITDHHPLRLLRTFRDVAVWSRFWDASSWTISEPRMLTINASNREESAEEMRKVWNLREDDELQCYLVNGEITDFSLLDSLEWQLFALADFKILEEISSSVFRRQREIIPTFLLRTNSPPACLADEQRRSLQELSKVLDDFVPSDIYGESSPSSSSFPPASSSSFPPASSSSFPPASSSSFYYPSSSCSSSISSCSIPASSSSLFSPSSSQPGNGDGVFSHSPSSFSSFSSSSRNAASTHFSSSLSTAPVRCGRPSPERALRIEVKPRRVPRLLSADATTVTPSSQSSPSSFSITHSSSAFSSSYRSTSIFNSSSDVVSSSRSLEINGSNSSSKFLCYSSSPSSSSSLSLLLVPSHSGTETGEDNDDKEKYDGERY